MFGIEVDEYPVGYGKLAAIVGSDSSFLIYRKFSWLHNRVLLHYQDELAELEFELEALDQDDFKVDDKLLISRRRDDGRLKGSKRKELLKKIDAKLSEYRMLPTHRVLYTLFSNIAQRSSSCDCRNYSK